MEKTKRLSSVRDQDIFSYRPTISYDRPIDSAIDSPTLEPTTSQLSFVMSDFIKYAPNQVSKTVNQQVSVLEDKLIILGQHLSHLSVDGMTFKNYQNLLHRQPFLTLDEIEKLNQFEQAHFSSIAGEVGVEIYKQLSQSIEALQSISNLFNRFAYQVEQPTDAMYAEEEAIVQQLIRTDRSQDLDKINYLAIAVDTQLGRSVLDLSHAYYTFGLNLYNQYIFPDDAYPLIESVQHTSIEAIFNRLAKACEKEEEKLVFYQKRHVFQHLLSRIQQQREELLLAHANVDGLAYAAQEDKVLRSLITSQSVTVFAGLIELVKFGTSIAMYLDDFEQMIQEKEVVRRLYKSQM